MMYVSLYIVNVFTAIWRGRILGLMRIVQIMLRVNL